MVAAKPHLSDVFEMLVLRDLLRIEVAVVVEDRHNLSVVVIQFLCGFCGKQKILVHKWFHCKTLLENIYMRSAKSVVSFRLREEPGGFLLTDFKEICCSPLQDIGGEHGLAGRGLAVQHAHQRGDCVVAAEFKLIIYRSKLRFAADAELRIVVADNSKLRRNVKIHSLGVFQRADCQFIIPGDDRVEREPLGSKGEKLFLCLRMLPLKKERCALDRASALRRRTPP